MSLSNDEIAELTQVIEAVANSDSPYLFEKLVSLINRLRLKYGDLPVLLSTKADFIDDFDERILLYEKTIELAEEPEDTAYIIQSVESLVEIYVYELRDYEKGAKWLTELERLTKIHGEEYIIYSLSDMRADLRRLLIRLV